ncbi:MAG TPA: hypothetical protein VF246_09235 [Acidimicrobiia bacterium]
MSRVVVFTLAYTFLLLAYGLVADSPLTLLYTGVNLGLMGLLALLHRSITWSPRALWSASLVGLGNMLGGVILIGGRTLYLTNVIGPVGYDKIYHFAAAAGLSLLAWEAVEKIAGPGARGGVAGLPMLVWLTVLGGGAVVEIAEFIGASIGDVNVGDYVNNALDLVANATGALLGVFLVAKTRHIPARP